MPANSTDQLDQLKSITSELYEKNLELVQANQETSLIQELYSITLKTADLNELFRLFLTVIVETLKLPYGTIYIFDHHKKILVQVANAKTAQTVNFPCQLPDSISLKRHDNLLVKTLKEIKCFSSIKMKDIFDDISCFDTLAPTIKFTSTHYPLIHKQEVIAVMSLFSSKNLEDLKKFELKVLEKVVTAFSIAFEKIFIYQDLQIANQKIRRANKRLKEVDALKDEFVSVASHELRTPMTAVKNYLWLAIHETPEDVTEKKKSYLDIAYSSTDRLINLVNDMLTISRIEGKRLKLEKKKIDLNEVVEQTYKELIPIAKTKKIDFKVDKKVSKLFIKADFDKIREVLHNTIGNALKFTPISGQVTLITDKSNEQVVIHVKDTGPGIEKEDIPKLFSKFTRLERSYSRTKETGTGLGLYICKNIIKLHEGEIKVESMINQGSTFSIYFPAYNHTVTQ